MCSVNVSSEYHDPCLQVRNTKAREASNIELLGSGYTARGRAQAVLENLHSLPPPYTASQENNSFPRIKNGWLLNETQNSICGRHACLTLYKH